MTKPDFHGVIEEIIGKPSSTANWTDDQWAEHDAKVAADRAAIEEADTKVTATQLTELGWPRLALQIAASNLGAISAFGDKLPFQSIVVLAGAPGVGKTVAAAAWALSSKHRPRFMRASEFAASSRYDADERAKWTSPRSLVLDDLGDEHADKSGSMLTGLNELVDVYYSDLRTLVITTNLGREEFASRYGARIVDRMRERGRWITMTGPSRRGR